MDRTLYPTVRVPPAPEWDDLTAGLPLPPPPPSNFPVVFTREPTSLKTSSNTYNTLWAIDNRTYKFSTDNGTGCLWSFVDSLARIGPAPTSPPTGSYVGADPVTGRAQQIDFKWRPLSDVIGYDVLLAKDVNFTLLLSQVLNLTPVDNKTGAWVVTPADQEQPSAWISPGILEVGKPYYWRVRASRALSATDNETIIHSLWSPVMMFSVQPGFMVKSGNNGPTLLTPVDGPCQSCEPPVRFSWTPVKNATTYEYILSSDPELKEIITKTTTNSTAFEYKDKLELSKPYYWQVKAISPVVSDASPVGTFSIESAPAVQSQQQPVTQNKVTATVAILPPISGFGLSL